MQGIHVVGENMNIGTYIDDYAQENQKKKNKERERLMITTSTSSQPKKMKLIIPRQCLNYNLIIPVVLHIRQTIRTTEFWNIKPEFLEQDQI